MEAIRLSQGNILPTESKEDQKTRKELLARLAWLLEELELQRQQKADAEEFAKLQRWFAKKSRRYLPLWEKVIAQELAANPGRSRAEVEKYLAERAEKEVTRLDSDINSQIVRTGMILTATTILFAVFAFRTNNSKSAWALASTITLALALIMTAIAFVAALMPLRPPLRRAWKDKFNKRHLHMLLMPGYYASWVMDCWLADRRTPVAQSYRKAHSIVVRLLIYAAILVVPGLGLSLFFR